MLGDRPKSGAAAGLISRTFDVLLSVQPPQHGPGTTVGPDAGLA